RSRVAELRDTLDDAPPPGTGILFSGAISTASRGMRASGDVERPAVEIEESDPDLGAAEIEAQYEWLAARRRCVSRRRPPGSPAPAGAPREPPRADWRPPSRPSCRAWRVSRTRCAAPRCSSAG